MVIQSLFKSCLPGLRTFLGVILFILLPLALATIACGGKNNVQSGSQKNPATNPAHKIFLQQVYPYEASRRTLWTEIFKVDPERRVDFVALEYIEAIDQSGQDRSFGGITIEKAKGGISITLGTRIVPEKTEKIIVKAKLILNDDVIDVTCGYRKRTAAERKALNSDEEWTYLDSPKEVRVSERH